MRYEFRLSHLSKSIWLTIDDVRFYDTFQFGAIMFRTQFIKELLDFCENVVLWHENGQRAVLVAEHVGQIGSLDQVDEHAVLWIRLERLQECLWRSFEWSIDLMQNWTTAVVIEVNQTGAIDGGTVENVAEDGVLFRIKSTEIS